MGNGFKALGGIFGVVLAVGLGILLYLGLIALEGLLLWGLGSLALFLLGIGVTITFTQCFGAMLVINIVAWLVHKIFSSKK